jgi:antitoxin component of RelBE/YafQ-DinJ toxin-antitoxin module
MAKKKAAKRKAAPFKEVTTGQERGKTGLLEELEELRNNGETSTARYQEVLKEIEVIFGTGETNSFGNFGTNDIDILKGRLDEMSKADLQGFCKKLGINPFHDKKIVLENVIKEFHRYQSMGNVSTIPKPIPTVKLDPENPKHKEILDWLNS